VVPSRGRAPSALAANPRRSSVQAPFRAGRPRRFRDRASAAASSPGSLSRRRYPMHCHRPYRSPSRTFGARHPTIPNAPAHDAGGHVSTSSRQIHASVHVQLRRSGRTTHSPPFPRAHSHAANSVCRRHSFARGSRYRCRSDIGRVHGPGRSWGRRVRPSQSSHPTCRTWPTQHERQQALTYRGRYTLHS